MQDEAVLKQFARWGKNPPTIDKHGTEADIQNNMKKLMPNSWRMEGNQLIGMTDVGELRQTISTDYILEGTDEAGLPKFKKVVL